MISENDFYKFIGLAVVILLVVSVCARLFKVQTKVIEGMTIGGSSSSSTTDKDKVADAISSNNDSVDDDLLVSKYRTSYEDTIVALEKNCSDYLLSGVVNNAEAISKDPTSEANQKIITALNNLSTFRSTLNTAMVILDKK